MHTNFLIYFLPENILKEGDSLLPLFFKFASGYAVRKVQDIQVGLKLSGVEIKRDISAICLC
jgi:hypothetical protein